MNHPTAAGFDGVVLSIGDKDAIRPARKRLQRDGRIIEHAEDSAAGLARVKRGGVSAVVLDHDPGSFLEFLGEVNRLPEAPPVIYVTASSEISLAIEALKTGAADFVIKTAGPDFEVQLLAALERALELARLRREKDRAHNEAREERDRAKALLEDVNHRVANSLALVIALVRMQASATPEASAKTVLSETEARIAAVANLHRTLYASEDILVVDLDVYLRRLVDELRRAVAMESLTPTLSVHAVGARIATDKAVAIGVIATELITNAIKYAYPPPPRARFACGWNPVPTAGSSSLSKTMASDSPADGRRARVSAAESSPLWRTRSARNCNTKTATPALARSCY